MLQLWSPLIATLDIATLDCNFGRHSLKTRLCPNSIFLSNSIFPKSPNSIFWSNSIYIELDQNIEFGLFGNIELDKNIEFGHSRVFNECRPKLQSKVAISKVAIRGDQSCNKNYPKLQQEPNQSYNKNQSCNQNMKFIKITKFNWNFHQKSTISYSLVTLISKHQV